MKLKLFSMLMIGAVAFANAQDKSLLETLVKKGTITEQEAAQIAKDSVVVTPGTADTKKLTINGGAVIGYNFGSFSLENPSNVYKVNSNGFDIRFAKLGIEAEIQGGWKIDFITDFGVEGRERNFLDKVVLSKEIAFDYLTGRLDVGMRKVNMGQEQGLDDFALFTAERSVATAFFTRPDYGINRAAVATFKNMGSRAIGIFWEGTVEQVKGMYYGISVVGGNSFEGTSASFSNVDGNNNLSFYVNFGYKGEQAIKNESFTYDVGMNMGYANGGFVVVTPGVSPGSYDVENNEMWAINPYVSLKWRGLTFMGEYFLQGVQNSALVGSGPDATPMGANIILAYKFDIGEFGVIEPVFRASFLATDGMGFDPLTVGDYTGKNASGLLFDRAQTYYVGANWYVVPSVKIGLGYEWGEYSRAGRYTGGGAHRATSNTVRAQLQVLF